MLEKMRGTRPTALLRFGVGVPLAAIVALGSSSVAAAANSRTHKPHHEHVSGLVTSVNGMSAAGTCGSGTSGSFDLAMAKRDHSHNAKVTSITVDVQSPTVYKEKGVSPASFANVCVGDQAKAAGSYSAGTLTATSVSIVAPRPKHVSGLVTSVNGVSTAGTCGSGTSGSFEVAKAKRDHHRGSKVDAITVDVQTSTTYKDKAVSPASFANVCVGDTVKAVGSYSTGTLTATSVSISARHSHKG